MIFDIGTDMIISSVAEALEDVGSSVSEQQFGDIISAINDGMPGVIQLIGMSMAEHWKQEAIAAGGWGVKYANAIKYEGSGTEAEVYLDEDMIDKGSNKPNMMFALMVENGVKSWSIKDALLKSDKVKIGPSGIRYITIPFPVSTPRSKGQGKMQSKFGGREMTRQIHNIVKSGGKIPVNTKLGNVNISGLTRYNTRQLHSQYGIFRRVSDKSTGWQYPGVGPQPVYPSVLSEVNKKVHETITSFLQEIVKEYTQ